MVRPSSNCWRNSCAMRCLRRTTVIGRSPARSRRLKILRSSSSGFSCMPISRRQLPLLVALPVLHQAIDGAPAAQVEIANAEIGALRDPSTYLAGRPAGAGRCCQRCVACITLHLSRLIPCSAFGNHYSSLLSLVSTTLVQSQETILRVRVRFCAEPNHPTLGRRQADAFNPY